MNSVQLLSELSKVSANMLLADSQVYFDTIKIEQNRIILDHRGDQPAITVAEVVELLSKQTSSKSIWIIDGCNEIPASYIKAAEFEGQQYIRFHTGF